MTPQLTPSTQVSNSATAETGHLLGPFLRQGDYWWTIYWEGGSTTAEREKDILNGQEA
jgi:hypothetical protein